MENKTRKLCSIQRIDKISPIEGADKIVKINVLGWELVAEKDLYKEGDKVIYCEIDTILPDIPEVEFMRKHKFRIRTIRLRGQISQGLLLPLSLLKGKEISLGIGIDVTDIIGATKYDPPIPAELSGKVKGNFPSFIPKTDEERIQTMPEILDEYKGTHVYITEKLDGTSFTCYYNNGEFGVCSRNLEFERVDNTQWKIVKDLKIEENLKALNKNFAIQGEIVGEGIQKNPLKLKGQHLYVFNVFDIDSQSYLDYSDFTSFCEKFVLTTVPIIEDRQLDFNLSEILAYANRQSVIYPQAKAEGIVIRSANKVNYRNRLSFKVISNEYLLSESE